MKRALLLAVVVIVAGLGSYGLTRLVAPPPPADEDQVAWLKREFKLTPEQAARIEKIHYAYIPVCSDHCALIVAARERLAAAPTSLDLQAEVARLEKFCSDATRAHVREVAAQMDARHARRFLELVEPRISRHDHEGPFGLK